MRTTFTLASCRLIKQGSPVKVEKSMIRLGQMIAFSHIRLLSIKQMYAYLLQT